MLTLDNLINDMVYRPARLNIMLESMSQKELMEMLKNIEGLKLDLELETLQRADKDKWLKKKIRQKLENCRSFKQYLGLTIDFKK